MIVTSILLRLLATTVLLLIVFALILGAFLLIGPAGVLRLLTFVVLVLWVCSAVWRMRRVRHAGE